MVAEATLTRKEKNGRQAQTERPSFNKTPKGEEVLL